MHGHKNYEKGFTLIELVVTITVLGIIAGITAPVIMNILSSMWFSHNSSAGHLVAREAFRKFSVEIREAIETPDSLRPYVSADGQSLRFYRGGNPADSIRYFFSVSGGSAFLFRSVGGSAPEMVPDYAANEVDFLTGSFSVDNGNTGRSNTGRVEVELVARREPAVETDSTRCDFNIFCRNFR
ncbi:type II secretion system protein [bacterium]|nr:type II secretion system protein [bacterium]